MASLPNMHDLIKDFRCLLLEKKNNEMDGNETRYLSQNLKNISCLCPAFLYFSLNSFLRRALCTAAVVQRALGLMHCRIPTGRRLFVGLPQFWSIISQPHPQNTRAFQVPCHFYIFSYTIKDNKFWSCWIFHLSFTSLVDAIVFSAIWNYQSLTDWQG